MVIHPLAQVLIFALILSEVLSAKLPGVNNKYAYALYLMAGMLFWIFGVFAVLGHFPDANAIWLPVLVLMTLALAMSLGTLLGVINVFMRDLGQVIPVMLNALFWLTPVVYNLNALPARYQAWFKFNPLYVLVSSYQNVLVYGKPPLWGELGGLVAATAVLAGLALLMFRKSSAEMVDSL